MRISNNLRCGAAVQILDPEDDPEEEEDGGAQDIDATRQAKSAVMKTSTRQVREKVSRGRDVSRKLPSFLFLRLKSTRGLPDLLRLLSRHVSSFVLWSNPTYLE